MGGFFSKVFAKLVGKKELKIIIIGLDNSGKTTILSTLLHIQTNYISIKSSPPSQVPLTACSHRLQHGNCQLQESTIPSLGPRRPKLNQVPITPSRQYWEMYYPNTNAVLYVVDSHDPHRLPKAAEELKKVLEVIHPTYRKKSCKEYPYSSLPTSRTWIAQLAISM